MRRHHHRLSRQVLEGVSADVGDERHRSPVYRRSNFRIYETTNCQIDVVNSSIRKFVNLRSYIAPARLRMALVASPAASVLRSRARAAFRWLLSRYMRLSALASSAS